ncbi:MAG: polysaccharide biosynthesis/export family protein [Alphaproteobacteria bacterium]
MRASDASVVGLKLHFNRKLGHLCGLGVGLALLCLALPAVPAFGQDFRANPQGPYGVPLTFRTQGQDAVGAQGPGRNGAQQPNPFLNGATINNAAEGTLGVRNLQFGSGRAADSPNAAQDNTDRPQPWIRRNEVGTPPSGREFGLQPYGSQIFRRANLLDRKLAISRDYRISPGDQIAVRTWGAWDSENVLAVDLQGNIFLPRIGPVQVMGLRNAELSGAVTRAVGALFIDNVQIYTNLIGVQPISVFVTGSVIVPGQYPGQPLDSLLYYLSRAESIDSQRGSYRDIRIIRNSETIAKVDLYQFLTNGELPSIEFRDGDTIVVGMRRSTVAVYGAVTNSFRYEIPSGETRGKDILPIVGPLPEASHVLVRGIREDGAFSDYVSFADFAEMLLYDGDELIFEEDRISNEILVKAIGNSGGPSRFSVRRSMRLGDVLSLIEVDPKVADTDAIFLRRKSVAERQRQAIERSLFELQRTVLTGESTSTTESGIRVHEAQLIERFVKNVRAVEPEGRVVLSGMRPLDVPMEDGDEIVIPEKTDLVLISGEVQVPQTVVWRKEWSVDDYLEAAGSVGKRGDSGNVLVVHIDGSIDTNPTRVSKGDHLMVLPKTSVKYFALFKDIVEVVSKVALTGAITVNAFD